MTHHVNPHSRLLKILVGAIGSLLSIGCGPMSTPAETGLNPPWSMGLIKADNPACSADQPFCWSQDEIRQFEDLLVLEQAIYSGRMTTGDHQPVLRQYLDGVRKLGAKLTAEEYDVLDSQVQPWIDRLGSGPVDQQVRGGILAEIRWAGINRLQEAYMTNLLAMTGMNLEQELLRMEKGDDASGSVDADKSLLESVVWEGVSTENRYVQIEDYSEGITDSMNLIRDIPYLGFPAAKILEGSGILNLDYSKVNAITFGEFDPKTGTITPSGLSRRARVDRITELYEDLTFNIGALSGVGSMVPYAGWVGAPAVELYALFRNHSRMMFEISMVYGKDVRQGRNLYNLVSLLLNEGLEEEALDAVISNGVLPVVLKQTAQLLGVDLPVEQMVKWITNHSINEIKEMFSKKARQAATKQALEEGLKGMGKTLAGYATVGLSAFISGWLDEKLTTSLAEDTDVASQTWLKELMLLGTTYLAHDTPRTCMFTALSALAKTDGVLDPEKREERYFQAMLAKPYYYDEAHSQKLKATERVRYAKELARSQRELEEEALECLEDFEDSRPQHKLSLLSILYGMIQIDMRETQEELALYARFRDILEGQGLFDGPNIDALQLKYMERAILILLHADKYGVVPDEYRESLAGVLPEETIDFLNAENVDPAVAADFDCGYRGVCQAAQ